MSDKKSPAPMGDGSGRPVQRQEEDLALPKKQAGTVAFSAPTTLEAHPIADAFPMMSEAELDELAADIKANGVRQTVVLYEDKILDGRSRYEAARRAGIEVTTFSTYEGSDPVGYVISLNLKRRHLDASQRAMVAAKLANIGHGGDRSKAPIGALTQADAGKLLNVGERSVERAAAVQSHGASELVSAVERGTISVSAAAEIADLPKNEQQAVVAAGSEEVRKKAKRQREKKAKAKRQATEAKLPPKPGKSGRAEAKAAAMPLKEQGKLVAGTRPISNTPPPPPIRPTSTSGTSNPSDARAVAADAATEIAAILRDGLSDDDLDRLRTLWRTPLLSLHAIAERLDGGGP